MQSRLVRVLFVLIGIAIGSAAGYFLIDIDYKANAEREGEEAVRDQASALISTIAEMRTGQVAYVARGQGEAFWLGRVLQMQPVLERQATEFAQSLTSPAAQSAFEPAAAAIENFQKLDNRVQEYVKDGSSLLAADLIFSDGLDSTRTASESIDTALRAELLSREASLAALRRRQLSILAGASGGVLLVMLVLGLTGARTSDHGGAGEAGSMGQSPGRASGAATLGLADAGSAGQVRKAGPVGQVEAANASSKLSETAKLCSDLARVFDTTQLPALLDRAAGVINASGIIVWMADSGGRELRPAMSQGYPADVIARMGSIPRDASNAVASAYRAGELRVVAGDKSASGAVVVPLTTTDGCVGVLSAEMRGGSEKDERSQALATILAAQLAMLVSPATTTASIPAKAAQA
jgi:hypothetical protein